jgi:hypothetical protein
MIETPTRPPQNQPQVRIQIPSREREPDRYPEPKRIGATVAVVALALIFAIVSAVLGSKVRNQRQVIAETTAQLDQLKAAEAKERDDLASERARSSDLTAQEETGRSQLLDLQAQVKKESDGRMDLQMQLDKAKTIPANLQAQLDNAASQKASLQAQLSQEAANVTLLRRELNYAGDRLTDLQSKLASANSKIENLQAQPKELPPLPIKASFKHSFLWGTSTLIVSNQSASPLNVVLAFTNTKGLRVPEHQTIQGGATLKISSLGKWETVSIASDGYKEVTLKEGD